MDVVLVRARTRGGRTVRVLVRPASDPARALFAREARGERAVALALVDAVAFCAREGHAVVARARAAAPMHLLALPDDETQWLLAGGWLRHRSSASVVDQLHAIRAAVARAAAQAHEDAAG